MSECSRMERFVSGGESRAARGNPRSRDPWGRPDARPSVRRERVTSCSDSGSGDGGLVRFRCSLVLAPASVAVRGAAVGVASVLVPTSITECTGAFGEEGALAPPFLPPPLEVWGLVSLPFM